VTTPHPGGRPSILTPEVIEDFRRLLPTVMYLETVGDYLGVSRMTWREWIRRGRKEHDRLARNPRAKPKQKEALYLQFFDCHRKAIAEGQIYDAGVIKRASADQTNAEGDVVRQGQWQAAAWRLERRFPKQWGRKDSHEHTGPNRTPVVEEVVVRVGERDRKPAEGETPTPPGASGIPGQ
jgi:transposase